MCMMVYVAAERPLELVPWDAAGPGFHVSELPESESFVRRQFGVAHVYYAGSHEGCGCGFQLGEYPGLEDDDRHLRRASLEAFAAYLARQLERVEEIELFACWDGDQSAPPEHHRRLTPEALRSEDFYFREKELSRIAKDAG